MHVIHNVNQQCSPLAKATAMMLMTVYVYSIPPKWATFHIASALILLALLGAKRDFLSSHATRTYAIATAPWLVFVLATAALQNLEGLPTATSLRELVILVFRVIGVGLGIMLFLHKNCVALRQIAVIVFSCLLINAILGIVQWLSLSTQGVVYWRLIRASGIVGNPNPYGFFMAIGLVLSAALLAKYNLSYRMRITVSAFTAIFLLAVLSSGSRGALLSAAAGLVVLLPPTNRLRIFVYTILLALLVLAIYTINWQANTIVSDGMRLSALKFSLEAITQRPITGWGLESFPQIPGHHGINSPHSLVADLALSSGVLTLLAFLFSTGWVCYRLVVQKTPHSSTLLALLISAFLAGTLEYSVLSSLQFREPWLLLIILSSYAIAGYGHRGAPGADAINLNSHPSADKAN